MKSFAVLVALGAAGCAAPVPLLFDTDFQTDCDDVGALAILHTVADRGEAEILAVMLSAGHEAAPAAVDVVNTYCGRPDLPVGVPREGAVKRDSKFAAGLAREFAHDLRTEDAVRLYRRILAARPDESVVILTVGYMKNLADLLRSGPDEESPLKGSELIRRKVRAWICMGGNFPRGDGDNVNFTRDPESVVYAVRHWPGPIVFCGREIGHAMRAGARLSEAPARSPVRRAYELYFGGTAKDRHCADLAAVLYAVRGLGEFWDLAPPGTMEIREDATFAWHPGPGGRHRYLVWKTEPRRVQPALESLMVR